jgi:integrase
MPKKPTRREWGSGSITWMGPSKALLRISTSSGVRSKTVRTAHRDHGGRGQAEEALAKFEAELIAQEDSPAGETLESVLTYYIGHVTRLGKTRGTVETYEAVAKRLPDDLKTRPIELVGPDDLDQFYGQLKDRGLSDRTIRTTHAVIRAALKQAVKSRRIASNPAEDATVPAVPKGSKSKVTPAEVREMIRVAAMPKGDGGEEDGVMAMAIFLATYAGLRRGELCGLRWDDLDVPTGRLRVERQWVPGVGGQYLADLKSDTAVVDGARTVTLDSSVVAAILRYKAWLRAELEREPDGWLLSHDAGSTPLRAKGLGEAITALGRRLGINATTHSFRRTSSTELVSAGVDVDTAARRQGHTTEVMLRDYSLGADDKAVAAAATLAARLEDQGLPIGQLFA